MNLIVLKGSWIRRNCPNSKATFDDSIFRKLNIIVYSFCIDNSDLSKIEEINMKFNFNPPLNKPHYERQQSQKKPR